MNKQTGGSSIIVLMLLLPILALFSWNYSASPSPATSKDPLCRPNYVNADGTIKSDAPEIMAPSYVHTEGDLLPKLNQDLKPYRLIKTGVGLYGTNFNQEDLRQVSSQQLNCPPDIRASDGHAHYHFCQWVHPALTVSPNPGGSAKYGVMYPAAFTGKPGFSADFKWEGGNASAIRYAEYQLIYLTHLKSNGEQVVFDGTLSNGNPGSFTSYDIYQRVREDSKNTAIKPLSQEVLKCVDDSRLVGQVSSVVLDQGDAGDDKSQLQLKSFIPKSLSIEWDWYYPACKPAIYLYPEEKTNVHVVVEPKGYLTYTDPLYPKDGWNVEAYPNGTIISQNKTYDYLYYESKIRDFEIKKPTKGYVVEFNKLPQLYSDLLPKLGLDTKQIADFKQYWEKVLPKSPYYFVGVMPKKDIDAIEPLTISPNPDTLVRVRLFFEALDKKITVEAPRLEVPKRNGFTVVEWGGMVKTDKDSLFTCSQ